MTREQAQVYAKLSKEDIAKIDCGYERHYEVLCSFANGAEIQMGKNGEKWTDVSEPYFYYSREYRVKPIVETAEPWKPKDGELYFCVKGSGDIVGVSFHNDPIDNDYAAFGNCFQTREEAEAAWERVRAALKGNY